MNTAYTHLYIYMCCEAFWWGQKAFRDHEQIGGNICVPWSIWEGFQVRNIDYFDRIM
jgi:hypothetical protein